MAAEPAESPAAGCWPPCPVAAGQCNRPASADPGPVL